MRISTLLIVLLLSYASPLWSAEWPAFRGRAQSSERGRAEGTGYPKTWSKTENIGWRIPLPEAGNSSPVVSDGRVFVTCPSENGTLRNLICIDTETGKELWKQSVAYDKPEPTHKTNPYCSASPAVNDERVVVWHGSAGLFCYSLDGKQLWSYQTGLIEHIWGHGSSPIIERDTVYLNLGPGKNTRMLALSLVDGKVLWEVPEPGGASGENGPNGEKASWIGSWSTPQIAELAGRRQVICAMPTRVIGYDSASGEILWYCTGLENSATGNHLAYTDPLIGTDIGVVLGGFKGPAFGFRLGGEGDITATNRLWRVIKRNSQRIGSGVIVNQHAYIPTAGPNGIECLDILTGETRWSGRTGSAPFWGSMIAADELLYVTDQSGTTFVIKPNLEKLEIVAENKLGEPSNSTPAFVEGKIYLRTQAALYQIAE